MSTEPAPIPPRALPARVGGVVALAVAVLAAAVEVIAIVVGSAGQWPLATGLAWAVIVLTVVALVLGVVAAVRNRGRAWGAAAIVVAVLANPLVQIGVLRALGGH
ncbi:MAG: hypothetical protein JWN36_2920 [Microbacteriaceae bacterium]|nr:hypothetical protein [Microbacteriaceae bacterium]